jgi:RNA polymerase sigma-70 factor (ECF subfamily)
MRNLAAALDELDDRTRIALEMHRLQDAKLREIAARLGVSVTTAHELVAAGLSHCRARLRR